MLFESSVPFLIACVGLYLAVTVWEAIFRRDVRKSMLLLRGGVLALVFSLALIYYRNHPERVFLGDRDQLIFTQSVTLLSMLVSTMLGSMSRYFFFLKGKFRLTGLMRPLFLTPILLLPLVSMVRGTGPIDETQFFTFCLLAFQNGFFWNVVLERTQMRLAGSEQKAQE